MRSIRFPTAPAATNIRISFIALSRLYCQSILMNMNIISPSTITVNTARNSVFPLRIPHTAPEFVCDTSLNTPSQITNGPSDKCLTAIAFVN